MLDAVKTYKGLQEQLTAATEPDAVAAIAKAAGFVISAEEIKRARFEVTAEELERLAGGCVFVNTVVASWDTL